MSVEYAVPSDANEAELWDIETKGLRILRRVLLICMG